MKYKSNFILLLFFLNNLSAQSDIEKFFEVGGDIFTAPAHFDRQDWTNLSASAAATSAAYFLDQSIREFSQENHTAFLNTIFSIDGTYHLGFIAVADAAIYAYGAVAEDDDIRNLGLRLTEATVYSALINYSIKILTSRSRPFLNKGNADFNPFEVNYSQTSFPSLHSTSGFAFSKVMADYIDNIYWKIGWYTFSSLVALARVYHDQHWFSDIIAGALLGYFIGSFVNNHPSNMKKSGPDPVPGYALTFRIGF
jgi:membrane-associated phospholipid phosphatase